MYKQIIRFDYGIPVNAYPAGTDCTEKGQILSNMHLHNEYEFLGIEEGTIKCVTPDKEFFADAGDLLFINTHTPHSTFDVKGGLKNNMVHFDSPISTDSVFRYVIRLSKVSDTPCFVFKNGEPITEAIKSNINNIIEECESRDAFWNDYVQANLLMIIAILRRNGIIIDYINKKSVELNKIRPVIEYINENYANDMSTADLSKILNFNESYFCRLFKNTIGASPLEYLNFVRICKAEHMLRKGVSISDATYDTGFSSLSYFNRVFKKYNHYSPRDYKKISKYTDFEYMEEFYNE